MSDEDYQYIHYSLFVPDDNFIGCAWALSSHELVTCAHVIADPDVDVIARRSFCPSDKDALIVLRTTGTDDPLSDVSFLTTKAPPLSKLPPPSGLGVCDPMTGQEFTVFGFPADKPNLGDFSNYEVGRQLPNGWFQVEISDLKGSELREGYSGSPAWDPVLHCVIGIVVGVDPHRRRQIAYIIPPSVLRTQAGMCAINKFPYFGPSFHDRIESAALSGFDLRRVARYLSSAAENVEDSVERYWIYACLGELSPDQTALFSLRRAIAIERDEFAVTGARESLSKFPGEGSSNGPGITSRSA